MGKRYRVSQLPSVNRVYVPYVLIPLWQMKLRERYGVEIDEEIIKILITARYEKTTWKWQRTIKKVAEELHKRGFSKSHAYTLAKSLVNAVALR
ncbi:MAG TPA: hypothetical protein ENL32_02075 [Methanomicrobia archaeon]|nr:hypothetical protein [Methanomicrobia archaeon]